MCVTQYAIAPSSTSSIARDAVDTPRRRARDGARRRDESLDVGDAGKIGERSRTVRGRRGRRGRGGDE